jgi:hypothetical protein
MTWLLATSFLFMLNRFGGIELVTDPPSVRFFQGNKEGEVTVYESLLKATPEHGFVSPGGVEYQLEELPTRVVHDANRGINSGSWKLSILNADNAVLTRLPMRADFSIGKEEEEMTFYGEEEQPE